MKPVCILLFVLISSINVNAQDKFITVGSGGGFAGTVTTYKITPSGKIFKGKGLGDIKFTECAKIKKSAVNKWISSTSEKTSANPVFNHPGNLYYFITYVEKGKVQAITWGDADHPVPDDVKKLYEDIQSKVNAAKYKPIKQK